MIGLLGTCMSVLLAAADGGAAGPAGPAGSDLEPTTQATSQPAAASQPSDGDEAVNVKNTLRRLWRESLQPPTATPTASEKLRETMEELRRVRVSPRSRSRQQLAAGAGGAASRPAELASRPAGDANDSAQAGLSKAVVEKLKNIPSSALASPADLADELYQGGHLTAAAAMYERAMIQGDDDTKAWALYQTANCRRIAKPQEAEALYLRVIKEHGKSPWAQLAAIEQKLLEWQRVNRPLELLDSLAAVGRGGAQGAATQPTTRAATQAATMPGGAKTQAASQPQMTDGTVTVRTRIASPRLAPQTQPDETTVNAPEPQTPDPSGK